MTTDSDVEGARKANGFEPWPGANRGRPSPTTEDWVLNVLVPAKQIIATALTHLFGGTFRDSVLAMDTANVIIARLAEHDPPLTIERIQ